MAINPPPYTFIDLFSGAGGFSLGFVEQGFQDLLAIDIDQDAIATYHSNFSDSTLLSEDIRKIQDIENDYKKIQELDLSNNNLKSLEGIEKFINLRRLNMNNNKINQIINLDNIKGLQYLSFRNNALSEIQGFEELINLEHLDLSGNIKISKIPDSIHEMQSLKILKLNNCQIKEFSEVVSNFFWDEQNYRYFSGYCQDDIKYYESTHKDRARSKGMLYKKFVEWVLYFKPVMLELNVSYRDIVEYERATSKKAIWNRNATKDFKKWLFNKKQTSIVSFM